MVVHPKWRWEISCQLIDFMLLLKIIGTTSRRVIIEISRWELWIAHEITPDRCLPFVLINMFSVIFWRQQSLTRKFPFPNKVKKWKTLPSYDFCYWWCKLWFRIFLSGTCGTCCCYCRIADRRNCIVTHLLQTEQSISTTIFYFHISLLHFFCDMINCQKSLANLFPVYPARDFLIYLRRAVANQRCANCCRCFCFWHADRQLHYQSLSTNSQLDTLEFCSLTGQPVD